MSEGIDGRDLSEDSGGRGGGSDDMRTNAAAAHFTRCMTRIEALVRSFDFAPFRHRARCLPSPVLFPPGLSPAWAQR